MTTPRRLRLRVLEGLTETGSAPDALRSRLGGRAPRSDPFVGTLVRVRAREANAPAVVLFADEKEAHLWIGDGLVRRVPRADVSPYEGSVPAPQAAIADSARLFAMLTEGDRVSFVSASGEATRGVVLEKHRFGALVDAAGMVVGVGFRRLSRDLASLS